MRTTPYTTSTGVRIGCRYNESPKPMPIDDADMLYIQTLFIHTPRWHRQRNLDRMTLFVCTGFAVFVMVSLLMAGK